MEFLPVGTSLCRLQFALTLTMTLMHPVQFGLNPRHTARSAQWNYGGDLCGRGSIFQGTAVGENSGRWKTSGRFREFSPF